MMETTKLSIVAGLLLATCVTTTDLTGQECDPADLRISVTPSVAAPGTPITVRVTNTSNSCLFKLPSTCVAPSIHRGSCVGTPVRSYACFQAITPIPRGGSRFTVWDQLDMDFEQVPDGTYAFHIRVWDENFTQLLSFCPTVVICSTVPASYGSASAGTGAVEPTMGSAGGLPFVGNPDFELTIAGGLGGASAVLAISGSPAAIPFPFGALLVGFPRVGIPLTLSGPAGVAGAGGATFPLAIPTVDALAGLSVFAQTLVIDAGSSGGIATTEGLQLTICPR